MGLLLLVPVVHANTYEGGIPLTTEKKGIVSGGLWFDAYPGFATSAQKYFVLPKHTTIDWARVYVGVYSGHKQNNYPGIAHVSLDPDGSGSFATPLGDENLDVPYTYPGTGGTGPVYVNDHCNRVTSDYLMWYDVTDKVSGKPLGVSVKTEKAGGSSFDGRIKFIALVAAYNDDDQDIVYYWVNQGHDPLNSEDNNGYTGETTFGTSSVITENEDEEENLEATLSTLYMASVDGKYTFNGEELSGDTPRGAYFGFNRWDVRDQIITGDDSTLKYEEAGAYYKIPLALLTVRIPERDAGTLEVTSNPPGVKISLDGEESDLVTNTTMTGISTGEHTVGVDPAGNGNYRKPREATVVIRRNEKSSVNFQLASVSGSVKISSEPAGAWVYLDGVNQSVRTDATLENAQTGNHTLTLKKTGFEDREIPITIGKENPEPVAEKLIPRSLNSTTSAGSDSESTGYSGTVLTLYRHGSVNGGLFVANSSAYSGLLEKDSRRNYPINVDLPKNATVKDARLYVYTTWSYNTADLKGKPASIRVDYNDNPLARDRSYLDRKGSGTYDYPAETHCYTLNPDAIRSGDTHFTVVNTGQTKDTFAVYGVVLVIVYEDPAEPFTEYWIGEGADMIFVNPGLQTDAANATTRMAFPGQAGSTDPMHGSLIAISTASSGSRGDENRITFNDQGWTNALTGGSSAISLARLDVTGLILPSGNTATIESLSSSGKGDYMENRNIILYLRNNTHDGAGETRPAFSEVKRDNKESVTIPGLTTSPMPAPAESGPIVENLDPSKKLYAVRVLSNPPGGLISIDYRYSGKTTPATIDSLPGGNHTFSVEMGGFAPAEQKVFITNNETLKFALVVSGSPVYEKLKIGTDSDALLDQEYYGGIYVDSNPGNADIYIDGKKTTFVTPGVVYGLNEGKHTVRVMKGTSKTKVTFPVESKDVFVDDGTITPVTFSVSENPYLLNISVTSKELYGYEFTLNGMRTKYKIPTNVYLQYASDNFVAIQKDNAFISIPLVIYNSIEQTQEISQKTTSFRNLWVESDPPGADIYIDGYPTGYATPYLIRNLSEGQHAVFITKSGYVPFSSTVRVNNEDPVRRFVLAEYIHGMLKVTSSPEGGKIYINNKDTGEKTPFTFQYMQAGRYTVRVVQNKTQAVVQDVSVEPNNCREVNLTLTKKGVKYRIA
ncbi:DUF3344 domain-containing protein [uncultured Methanoregula sp.]|uniref:DUF3344 domain-containing protein n=1 Tax=uncultured Methanoregula sp. TaxID=1005933 RepID=UPI003749D738